MHTEIITVHLTANMNKVLRRTLYECSCRQCGELKGASNEARARIWWSRSWKRMENQNRGEGADETVILQAHIRISAHRIHEVVQTKIRRNDARVDQGNPVVVQSWRERMKESDPESRDFPTSPELFAALRNQDDLACK